jgi:hypothetical protein
MRQFALKHPVAITVSSAIIIAAAAFLLVMTLWQRFTDSDRVYCLSEEHQSELVEAAVALDLAQQAGTDDRLKVDGREITPKEWWSDRPQDFQRVCLALNPPQQRLNPLEAMLSNESGLASGLAGVLGALVGSGILYLSERTRDRTQRREDEARRLNDLGTTFKATVENFVRQRSAAIRPDRLPVDQILGHRNALVSELELVKARYPGWDGPDAPLRMLSGALSDQILEDWDDPDQRTSQLTAALDQLTKQIGSIAVELEGGGPTVARR